jgi:AraC family transcriptional regulator, transcriptional activator FtrA
MKDHLVAALAYDGLCTFEFGCVVEMFSLERPELGVDWYRFAVCAAERGPLRAAGGIQVVAPHGLAMLARADTIVVPGWRRADEPPPEPLLRALRRSHSRGARLASICSGVFVLAATGLLDGKAATTHWRYADKLRERHPAIDVRTNELYVDEGDILTSAGSAAGLDMLLHLVRRDHGAKVANQVAQRLVIAPHRLGDQAQFVPRPMPVDDAARLSRLMDWVRAHPAQPHTPASLAARAAMSVRTLQRQFQETAGLTPLAWVIRERVAAARELLESSRRPMTDIAERTGFGSEESFRRHFRLVTGISPATYRRQFATRIAG